MSYTANDIIGRVQTRLKDSSISTSVLLQLLNDTNREVCNRYMLDFMQSSTTFNTVDSTASYALSTIAADLQQLTSLRITSPDNSERWLQPMTAEDFDRFIADPTSESEGSPEKYYLWDNTVYLYPVPDDAYTIAVRYIKTPTTVESGDQPDIPEEYQEILTLGTLYRAMQINDNFDQALVIKNQFDTQVIDMIRRLRVQPTGSPRIMSTGFRRRDEGIL